MNRGRRRGGVTGLSGLRDGVKRRLFDPNLVPTKPDPKCEVNRLVPLLWAAPVVNSRLSQLRGSGPQDEVNPVSTTPEESELYTTLFRTKALVEFAFRTGPFYHPLPEIQEGIEVTRAFTTPQTVEASKSEECPISTLHLILAHKEINHWFMDEPLNDLDEPESWYPKELSQLTKPNKRRLAAMRKRRQAVIKASRSDLSELVSDQLIAQAVESVKVVDRDEAVENLEDLNDAASDADSDDARWNGEVNPDAADPDELDDDELDNDYCQNYFDNGEADLSDDNLEGDEDEAGRGRYE